MKGKGLALTDQINNKGYCSTMKMAPLLDEQEFSYALTNIISHREQP